MIQKIRDKISKAWKKRVDKFFDRLTDGMLGG